MPGIIFPPPPGKEYKPAFLREFKKALGEKVDEVRSGLCVKILGPGCPACDHLEQTVMAVLADLGIPAAVEHIRDLKEIARLRIFGAPGLMINDEVKAVGQTPSKGMLKKWLTEALNQKD